MPTDFPGAVDDIQNDISNSTLLTDLHPSLHNDLADAIMALETQALTGGTVADGSITSAKIADKTIQEIDIADGVIGLNSTLIQAEAINAAKIQNNTITSAKIADGTIQREDMANLIIDSTALASNAVTSAKLADQNVTNAKLASDTARANLLTNGGFEIWQRGNGPFTTAILCADRWATFIGAGSSLSVSKNTSTVDRFSTASLAATYTHSALSYVGAGVENPTQYRSQTISCSVRVHVNVANAVRLSLTDGVTSAEGAYHPGNSTWQTLTATYTVPAGATGLNLLVRFEASCTAYVDNAMLVLGTVATDYAPLHPADDLARCLRYYERLGPGTNFPQLGNYAAAGAVFLQSLTWSVKKGVVPSVTIAGTFAYVNASGVSTFGPTIDGVTFGATATALGSAVVYSNSSGYLIAEANPS